MVCSPWHAVMNASFICVGITTGIVGLVSTALFVSRHDLGFGPGGIERFAAYTTTTWQIVAGLIVLRHADNPAAGFAPGGRFGESGRTPRHRRKTGSTGAR